MHEGGRDLEGGPRGGWIGGWRTGDNFVFQFWCRKFPREIYCAIWGTCCCLCILRGGGRRVSWRCCRQLVHLLCKWLLLLSLMGIVQIVGLPQSHTTDRPQGTEGWGCRSSPCLMALHQKWRCAIFPSRNCTQTNPPPPPAHVGIVPQLAAHYPLPLPPPPLGRAALNWTLLCGGGLPL